MQFLDVLTDRPLVGDGAMGTYLYAQGITYDQCFEALNLTRPDLVREIHGAYLDAGARVIETNTFGANAERLGQFGEESKTRQINEAAAALARESVRGFDAFVAGSVGPLSRDGARQLPDDDKTRIWREQAEALANAGVDLLLLETFVSFHDLRLAYRGARAAAPDLPIVTQMAFLERTGTLSGDEPVASLTEAWRMGADVVGVNCGRGARLMLEILQSFAPRTGHPLSAFFNAGSPDLVDGRYVYLDHPDYLADMAERMVKTGANLVGGCCGTTPAVIRAVADRVANVPLRVRPRVAPPPRARPAVVEAVEFPPGFLDQPDDVASVIVELDPPRGMDYEPILAGARRMREVGVDLVSVAENPLASPRLGNVAMAVLMKHEAGVEPLVHFTCRDRNLIGLQSDIMGAAALGLRYVLCITGDPVPRGGEFGARGVYDVVSFGLIKLVDGLNRGVNAAGASIKIPTRLHTGVAFGSNVKHLHVQIDRLKKKIDVGAQFALTQPCWDPERIAEIYRATEELGIQLYMGVMPFCSERNAEFLHNEVPGMLVPEETRARMRGLKGEAGRRRGIEICEELLDVIAEHSSRVYLITPFRHFEMTAHLTEYFKAKVEARIARRA